MIRSKDYWEGYNHAQKEAEKRWEQARSELTARFIEIIEDSRRDVKGIGPKVHKALVEYVIERMMNGGRK
ncbi:hypothetical protein [Geobacillus phage TP-84]|uniref:Uncharacterized protein n=1 Tax=Geobacillus phage TP-84 TaxID=1965361 RepID=A0A1U9WQK8_9CAUD|nr:hypothetical protein MUK65_gp40 [Geobacillus phage TP-84]AQY55058.1 hypothetical protein [Geobacillus phage TP-84]